MAADLHFHVPAFGSEPEKIVGDPKMAVATGVSRLAGHGPTTQESPGSGKFVLRASGGWFKNEPASLVVTACREECSRCRFCGDLVPAFETRDEEENVVTYRSWVTRKYVGQWIALDRPSTCEGHVYLDPGLVPVMRFRELLPEGIDLFQHLPPWDKARYREQRGWKVPSIVPAAERRYGFKDRLGHTVYTDLRIPLGVTPREVADTLFPENNGSFSRTRVSWEDVLGYHRGEQAIKLLARRYHQEVIAKDLYERVVVAFRKAMTKEQ